MKKSGFIPQSSQIAVSETDRYYEIQNSSVSLGNLEIPINRSIDCTVAGKNIENTAIGSTLVGVGKWTGRTSYFPDFPYINASTNGFSNILNLTHKTSSDYGILWYASTATTSLTFEIWLNTPTTTEFRCMFSNTGTGYNVGFYFSAGYILTPKSDKTNIETTGIAVTSGWNHYRVEWSSGGLHKLFRNGILLESKTGCTETNAKTLELGVYQPSGSSISIYANMLALSDETGFTDWMTWNNSLLHYPIHCDFSIAPTDLQNMTIRIDSQTNISTVINTSIWNVVNNTYQFINSVDSIINTSTIILIPVFGRNYYNDSGGISLLFTGFNYTQSFLWNLSQLRITIVYFELTEVEILNVTTTNVLSNPEIVCIVLMVLNLLVIMRWRNNRWLAGLFAILMLWNGVVALLVPGANITFIISLMLFSVVINIMQIESIIRGQHHV